jgi:predicted transposase YdaD
MGLFQEARDEAKREGIQQGRREGLWEGIQLALEVKFGEAGLALMPEIKAIQDPDLMRKIKEALRTANSPEEIRLIWESPTSH